MVRVNCQNGDRGGSWVGESTKSLSGKEKAHKRKQIFPVTARAGGGLPTGGGGLPTGGQRSKVYVLCAEPKEHKRFASGCPARRNQVPGREDR